MNTGKLSKNSSLAHKNGTNFTRRNFLTSCSACAACVALKPFGFINQRVPAGKVEPKIRIKILYSLHEPVQTKPDWPNIGFDFNPVMIRINNTLKEHFPDFEFIPELATGPEEAETISR